MLELGKTDFLERTFLIFLLFDTNSKRFKGEDEEEVVGMDRRGLRKLLREGESDGLKRLGISHEYLHTLSLSHIETLSLSITHTLFFPLSLTLSPSLSITHTHPFFLSLTQIHTHAHTQSLNSILCSSYCIVYFVSSPLSSDEKMNNLFFGEMSAPQIPWTQESSFVHSFSD